ncbi:MAG: hypothetical protein IKR28_01045, partial [Selenomonadaceae bacterium]|nr:hypothetical protein [Selenomonadaceae bacterium]
MIFFISTAVLALSWWLCSKIEGEWHGNKKGGLDYRGSILYFISSLSIMYGLSVFVRGACKKLSGVTHSYMVRIMSLP